MTIRKKRGHAHLLVTVCEVKTEMAYIKIFKNKQKYFKNIKKNFKKKFKKSQKNILKLKKNIQKKIFKRDIVSNEIYY
jgi:hypothetical protein